MFSRYKPGQRIGEPMSYCVLQHRTVNRRVLNAVRRAKLLHTGCESSRNFRSGATHLITANVARPSALFYMSTT
jgi:hypothetical protein